MVLMDIVPVNVPDFLGLDVLDSEGLCAYNVSNHLVHHYVLSRSSDEVDNESFEQR